MTSGRRKEGGGGEDTYRKSFKRKPSSQPESIFQSEKAVSQVPSCRITCNTYDPLMSVQFVFCIDGMMMSSSRTVLGMVMKANRYILYYICGMVVHVTHVHMHVLL